MDSILLDLLHEEQFRKHMEEIRTPLVFEQRDDAASSEDLSESVSPSMEVDPYIYDLSNYDLAVDQKHRSPFVSNSPEALQMPCGARDTSHAMALDSSDTSDNVDNTTESSMFVRRSMLEKPRKRRRMPSRCSLSIRDPGSDQRRVIQVEEIPVICRRLRIRHVAAGYERMLEVPEIMLMARRKRVSGLRVKHEVEHGVCSLSTSPRMSALGLNPVDLAYLPESDSMHDRQTIKHEDDDGQLDWSPTTIEDCMIEPALLALADLAPPQEKLLQPAPHRSNRLVPSKVGLQSAHIPRNKLSYGICKPLPKSTSKTELSARSDKSEHLWWRVPTWRLVPVAHRHAPKHKIYDPETTTYNFSIV